ncbi:Uncharacterised protein [Mycobacteroides abscessus subsp. abscessus]|nr:Uncharacterised protein [Mycobacteroides abscessus subsp. abscessus]
MVSYTAQSVKKVVLTVVVQVTIAMRVRSISIVTVTHAWQKLLQTLKRVLTGYLMQSNCRINLKRRF